MKQNEHFWHWRQNDGTAMLHQRLFLNNRSCLIIALTLIFFLALKRLKAVCDAGFISVLDFRNNPLKVLAAHELGIVDPSMGTKMTVQVDNVVKK
jgi:hypothetical protein